MTTTRRRVLRPAVPQSPEIVRRDARTQKLRTEREKESRALERSMARLNRICRAIDKQRKRIVRLDRRIAELEPSISPP